MGLEAEYIDFMEKHITATFGDNRNGLFMFELGDQELVGAAFKSGSRPDMIGSTGKSHYTSQGYRHVSVDMNGMNGALALDLRNPALFEQWYGTVDVLTNSGTTEHVEPHSTQYDTFKIIHDLTKVGGLMFHIVPDINELNQFNSWRGHCTNYYSEQFFQMLADHNDYEVLESTFLNRPDWGLVSVALRKRSDRPFMADRDLLLSQVALVQ
jgi:hypothetical protein